MADIRTSGLYNRVSFTVVTSAGGAKTATLATVFSAGVYTIQSIAGDTDLEIYLGAENGTNVGSSAAGAKAIVASGDFKYVTTVNANTSDAIIFTLYQLASDATTLTAKTDAFWAPPAITDITPSSLYNQNATTVITGSNFASNAGVQFRKSDDATLVNAKYVTRTSETSITATRPDSFLTTDAPYDVVVTNATTGLSVISLNAVTAGSAPSWSTSATLPGFQKTVAYSQTVVATDSDASPTLSYSVNSSTLPTGITFSAGTFSGTPTANTGSYSASIRATDLGGNYVDRTFTLTQDKPDAPIIGTATSTGFNTATIAFTVPAYTGTSTITTYTATSSPAGGTGTLSQSGSGTINVTGLTGSTNYTFTVTATNSSGTSVASSASNQITTVVPLTITGGQLYSDATYNYRKFNGTTNLYISGTSVTADLLVIAGGGGGGNGGNSSGGGGAGGVAYFASQSIPINTYAIVIGAGGSTSSQGVNSYIAGYTEAVGGGAGGGGNGGSGGSGGGGGGGSASGGGRVVGQGNIGGNSHSNSVYGGGGGGGAGAAGQNGTTGGNSYGGNGTAAYSSWAAETSSGVVDNSIYYYAGGGGGGFGPNGAPAYPNGGLGGGGSAGGGQAPSQSGFSGTANSGGGGGGGSSYPYSGSGASGGSGIVIMRWTKSQGG